MRHQAKPVGYVTGGGMGMCACCVESIAMQYDMDTEGFLLVCGLRSVPNGDEPLDCIDCGDRFSGPVLAGEVGYR